jgi:hypothetical protein
VHADGTREKNADWHFIFYKETRRWCPSGCLRVASPRAASPSWQPRRKLHHRHDQVHGTHTRTLGRSQSLSQEVKVQNQVNLIVEYIASERARASGGLPPLCQSRSFVAWSSCLFALRTRAAEKRGPSALRTCNCPADKLLSAHLCV